MRKNKLFSSTRNAPSPLENGLNVTKKPKPGPAWKDEFEYNSSETNSAIINSLSGPIDMLHFSSLQKSQKQLQDDSNSNYYAYDEVYDEMKANTVAIKKDGLNSNRTARYIDGLLDSAKTRKLDLLRSKQKALQKERENEGKEFEDKEQFVTNAYKEQLDLFKTIENEESKAAEGEQKNSSMVSFYSNMLQESDDLKSAAISAANNSIAKNKNTKLENISTNEPDSVKTNREDFLNNQKEIAKLHGETLLINQDNHIIDKRQLLSSGLNLVASKNTSIITKNNYENSNPDKYSRNSENYSARKAKRGYAPHSENTLYGDSNQNNLENHNTALQKKNELEMEKIKSKLSRKNDSKSISDARLRYELRRKTNLSAENS
ncbi:hypothetical protein BB561_000884 [Smittium simulii]|uniref:Nuclear speckle splicing regulatory protein 1 N-terminal domain-containing protein n=1 Tax=Smittium simulii TaxID=133385 RepID=A0A2T9YX51_9FUNG|nr:hypothetical protein BB561_000884 [Smittium simulii]